MCQILRRTGKKLQLAQSATSSIAVAKGKQYSQIYNEVGTLTIGDNMNPLIFGAVIVK